jgi:O-antigen/teichoic acid export membrane protein
MAGKSTTRGDVLKLAIGNAFDSGLRLAMPIVLVRILDQEQFGGYRLFWLIANTLTMLVPLGMSRSLLYFLPRSNLEERAAFVSQTIVYLALMTLPIAIVLAWGPSWIPGRITSLTDPGWLLGAFSLVWMVSSLIQILPNADRNIRWQMWATISLSVVRIIVVLGAAVATRNLQSVFVAILVFAVIQALLLTYYVATRYGLHMRWPRAKGMRRQLGYAIPFGISGALARARGQVEQWIVAFLFLPGSLAIFAIGVGFNGILGLARSSIGGVLLPKMSHTHAAGDVERSLELNNRGNLAICFLIFPMVAFIWIFAAPLVEFLYTASYLDAVPVIRVYALTMILMSVELATVLLIFEQGRFVAKVSASVLIGAAILSYLGASWFGLPGVAAGGATGTLITRTLNFRRAAKMLGIPFSRLQDWSTLGKILVVAALSGAVSGYLVSMIEGPMSPLMTLLVAAPLFAVLFLLLVVIFRIEWIALCMLGRRPWPVGTKIQRADPR